MNNSHFCGKLREIYAAFGKGYPVAHISDAIFRRIDSLPDGFMDYALDRLENQPDMPRNMGYHLRHVLWPEYLEKHPELKTGDKMRRCNNCSPDLIGSFWAWDADGKRYCLKCACNSRPDMAHIQAWTPRMAVDAGMTLSDPGTGRAQDSAYLPPAARKAIGHTERPRASHIREVAYADAENW